MSFFKCPKPELTPVSKREAQKAIDNPNSKGYEVAFPVSYRYNGGIIVDDEWYEGFDVPKPDIPKGWHLCTLGVGLQLNARPPYATMYLERDE